jgi:hypothetical protein
MPSYHDIPASVTVTNLTDHALYLLGGVVVPPAGQALVDLESRKELARARLWTSIQHASAGGLLRIETVPTVAEVLPVPTPAETVPDSPDFNI